MSNLKNSWQHKLALYLGDNAGKELRVGDLFNLFGPSIPLEIASRRWVLRNGGQELDSNEIMRFAVFSKHIHALPLVKPPYHRTEKFTKDTVIVSEAKICAGCGKPFVANHKYCGFECGTKFGAHLAAKARPPKPPKLPKEKKLKRQRLYADLTDESLRIFKELNERDEKRTAAIVGELIEKYIEDRLANGEINEKDKVLLMGAGG